MYQPRPLELWITEKEFDYQNVGLTIRVKRQLHHEETKFQVLDIFDTFHYGKMMTLDGIIQLTEGDEFFYHEMLAHPCLFAHPNPKRVLVVGGGDGGTAREVLRHPEVEVCEQAEIDEGVIRAARQWFPSCAVAYDDPRMDLHVVDAIKYIADAASNSYDAIIIDSSDPVGPGVGLFSVEFYESCARAMKDQAVIVAQTGSFWYQQGESREACLRMRQVFGTGNATIYWGITPTYPSGLMAYTLGTKGLNWQDFASVRRPQGSTFEGLKYYNANIHMGSFQLPTFVANGLASHS